MIILLREITVSGLREFLAGLQVSVPVSQLAKWKTTLPAGLARRPDPRAARCRNGPGCTLVGLVGLWAAAALTLVTGWDYLRVGLKHMD